MNPTGNLGRHGDSPSEANHSSYCARIGPASSVEPAVAVKDMIERQIDINAEKNSTISQYHLQCKTDARLIESKAGNNLSRELKNEIAALSGLNKDGYSLWKKAAADYKNYEKRLSTEHSVGSGIQGVWRKCLEHPQKNGPRYVGPNQRCNCDTSIAFPGQCSHDIAFLDGDFVKERWSERYHQQEQLESSRFTCMQEVGELPETETAILPMVMGADDNGDGSRTSEPVVRGSIPIKDVNKERSKERAKLTYAFILEVCKSAASNIFKHSKSESLLGMIIKVNELATQGSIVSEQSLEDTTASYSSAFTHSRQGTEMFSQRGHQSLKPATASQGSNTGRPPTQRMKSRYERITTGDKRSNSRPRLTNSQSAARRHCGFCKKERHQFITCPVIISHSATPYKKGAPELDTSRDYLGAEKHFVLQVLPDALATKFRANNPSWNCKVLPANAHHIMLCNLYWDFREANSSDSDNIVELLFFNDCGVQDSQVYYAEVKKVREWLALRSRIKGLVLTTLKPP
jgi:hypothetical protein